MPANEGGTHGLYERMRSDGEIRRRTPMNAGIQKNLTGRCRPSDEGLIPLNASQQPANWLAAIPRGTMKLVEQLRR